MKTSALKSLRYAELRCGRVIEQRKSNATGVQQTKRSTLGEAEAENNISCENFEISKSKPSRESVRKVVCEEEKEVMLLGNDSCGSYKAVAHEKDGDNALFPKSDDNSSTWYGNELLWAPSSPQKLKLGIVLSKGQVDVVLRLSSLSFHDDVSKTCIELKKHLITASYVDDETSMLHEMAKNASITVLSETSSHNLAFSMNLSPLNSVRQRKNVLNPKPLIRKLCKEVAHSSHETWLPRVESEGLPQRFAKSFKDRRADFAVETKLTVCGESDGDVLVFPDMIRYKALKDTDVDAFVEDVLVNGKPWTSGIQEELSGSFVFVCAHGSRDKRCGVCGPALIEKFEQEIGSRGLSEQIFVKPCSHIGGHKYAGNLIVISPDSAGNQNWFKWLEKEEVLLVLGAAAVGAIATIAVAYSIYRRSVLLVLVASLTEGQMFATRNLLRTCRRSLSSLLHSDSSRNLVVSSNHVTSNVMLHPSISSDGNSNSFQPLTHQVFKGWSRAMSTARGRSMRSKVRTSQERNISEAELVQMAGERRGSLGLGSCRSWGHRNHSSGLQHLQEVRLRNHPTFYILRRTYTTRSSSPKPSNPSGISLLFDNLPVLLVLVASLTEGQMFATRNLLRTCRRSLSSLLHSDSSRNLVVSSNHVTSNVMLHPSISSDGNSNSFQPLTHQVFKGWSRAMSTARGRSMRSKVESRMRKESGKTLREIRRAKKLKKKLMTDEERLIYNLKRTIIMFRGRNYRQPKNLIPVNTLTKRKALLKARFEQALESQKLNIKKTEQQLRRMGVNPEDPVAMASIQRVASTFFNAIDKKEGSPYVFHGDKKSERGASVVNTEGSEPGDEEDSDQEELDRFIAEIEEAADKEWEEEEAAEQEETGRIRYWNREEFAGRSRDSSQGFRRNERDTRSQRRSNHSDEDDDSDQLDSGDDDEIPRRFDRPRSDTRRQGNDFMRRSSDPRSRVRSDEDVLSDLDNTMWDSEDEEDAPANYISSSDEEEDENRGVSASKQPRFSNYNSSREGTTINNSKTKSGKQKDEDCDSD
ncbi:hypothetical protein F2Q70_00018400 [Brassica cretica]|uniref:Uncharacterized protein n=1 Tax=Brassica cretica TaxID=69181 RepID=A0A8S9I5R5_BRACR|nr:hypothetical protein F2Q70_00018400 [Brassica cretica]